MIDISLNHSGMVMMPFLDADAEHFGYADELRSLDLSDKVQAKYAIRKWIFPPENIVVASCAGWGLIKEAMRFCLTLNVSFSGAYLPGIDISMDLFREKKSDYFEYKKKLMNFQIAIWNDLFCGETFSPVNPRNYRQRVDVEFAYYPHCPEKWGEPEYRPWGMDELIFWGGGRCGSIK